MNDHNITRLVVGEIYTVNMGKPVGHQVTQQDVSKILRWDNGRWKTSETLSEKLKRQASFGSNVLTLPTARAGAVPAKDGDQLAKLFKDKRVIWGAGIAGVFLVALGVFTVAIRYVKSSDEFGFVPTRTPAEASRLEQAVKTVDVPFVRPADDKPLQPLQEQPIGQSQVAPAVPTVSPAGLVTPGQAAPAGQGIPSVQPSNQPAARNDAAKAPAQSAMILDADATPAKPSQQAEPPKQAAAVPIQQKANQPAQQQPAKPATTPAQAAAPAAQAAPAKQPQESTAAPRAGGGLVAVTPDGKIALFTNPTTRLPERFSVGDKLPSGEVIKSIDKSGKVVTNAKEYKLE